VLYWQVEITRPGQSLSLYTGASIKAKDKDSRALRRPPLLYTERGRAPTDAVEAAEHGRRAIAGGETAAIGYSSRSVKEFIQSEESRLKERELLKGHGERPELRGLRIKCCA
jgi:hypothetical protein